MSECPTCHHDAHEPGACTAIFTYDRPGGPPGNQGCTCGLSVDVGASAPSGALFADVQRIVDWYASTPRTPAHLAFTAGPERLLADVLEGLLADKEAAEPALAESRAELDDYRAATKALDAEWTDKSRCPVCGHGWASDCVNHAGCVEALSVSYAMARQKQAESHAREEALRGQVEVVVDAMRKLLSNHGPKTIKVAKEVLANLSAASASFVAHQRDTRDEAWRQRFMNYLPEAIEHYAPLAPVGVEAALAALSAHQREEGAREMRERCVQAALTWDCDTEITPDALAKARDVGPAELARMRSLAMNLAPEGIAERIRALALPTT